MSVTLNDSEINIRFRRDVERRSLYLAIGQAFNGVQGALPPQ